MRRQLGLALVLADLPLRSRSAEPIPSSSRALSLSHAVPCCVAMCCHAPVRYCLTLLCMLAELVWARVLAYGSAPAQMLLQKPSQPTSCKAGWCGCPLYVIPDTFPQQSVHPAVQTATLPDAATSSSQGRNAAARGVLLTFGHTCTAAPPLREVPIDV